MNSTRLRTNTFKNDSERIKAAIKKNSILDICPLPENRFKILDRKRIKEKELDGDFIFTGFASKTKNASSKSNSKSNGR